MKAIRISFEVSFRAENDITEEKIKKEIARMLQIYGRSNRVCVDSIVFSPVFRRGFSGTACRGFGCKLSETCLRYKKWHEEGAASFVDYCNPETREMYVYENIIDDVT